MDGIFARLCQLYIFVGNNITFNFRGLHWILFELDRNSRGNDLDLSYGCFYHSTSDLKQ